MSTLASLAVQITGNISGLSSALGQAQGELNGFAGGVDKMAAQMRSVGTGLSVGVTAPLIGVAGTALNAAAGFEQSMNVLQQVSGATGAQMEAMEAQALALGAQTSFSAGEAAQGMLELAKAGLSAEQSSAAIGGVLNLAAAGGLSVASSAEIAANALNSFGLEASAMPMVADLMAAAANNSSIEIGDMAAAFQMSSAVFSSNSQSIGDLSTAIAILGNSGLKGSDAGTSLKTMLMSLTAPTDAAAADMERLGVSVYDAQGNMRAMPAIMADLSSGLSGVSQQQRNAALTTIFGSDAIRAANILLKEGSSGWEKMAASLGEQGAAADVADARMKGLGGALEYLKGSIESALIGAALPWTEMLGDMLRWVGDLVAGFGTLSPTVQRIAVVLGIAAAAAGPLLIGFSMMLPALGVLGGALAALVSPLGLVVAGIAAIVALDIGGIGTLLGDLGRYFAAVVTDGDALNDWLTHLPGWMQPVVEWLGRLTAAVVELVSGGSLANFGAALGDLFSIDASGWIASLTSAWETVRTAFNEAQTAVATFTASDAWTTASETVTTSLGEIGTVVQGAFSGEISLDELRQTVVTEVTNIGTAVQGVLQSDAFTAFSANLLAAFGLETLPATISEQVTGIQTALQPLADFLAPAFERLGETLSGLGEYFANFGTQVEPVRAAAGELGAALAEVGTAIGSLFQGGEGGSPSAAAAVFAGALSLALNVLNGLASALEPLISGVLAQLTTVFSGLATIISGLTTGIGGLISGDTEAAWEGFGQVVEGIAGILTGTLSNALTVVSGLLDALGVTITGTLSDWGFDEAAASVQVVIDKVTGLIDWLAQLAGGEISIESVVPEWWTALTEWAWPEWTPPTWLAGLFMWTWPGLPGAPGWLTTLLSWVWPGLPDAPGWLTTLLSWAWPGLPGAPGWLTTLLSWVWPGLPGAPGWLTNLLDWEWPSLPSFPSLPGWLGGGEPTTPGNNAAGTEFWRGGLTWVGENGRELVQLPRGSRIYNNRDSEQMAATGNTVTVYATVQNGIDVEMLAYRVADVLGRA